MVPAAPREGSAVAPSRRARAPTARTSPAATSRGRRSKGPRGRKRARRLAVCSARSPHGSGRSAASRVAYPAVASVCVRGGLFPLTPRLVGRCARERLAEQNAPREVDLIRPHSLSTLCRIAPVVCTAGIITTGSPRPAQRRTASACVGIRGVSAADARCPAAAA
jgi:hypothetical protein